MMTWILDSGPIGLTIVGLIPVAMVWALAGTARPVRWWADVWVAFCAGLTNLGVMGTTMGLLVGFSAIAKAPAARKAAIMSQVFEVGARPLILAVLGIVVVTAVAAVAHGVRAETGRFDRHPPAWGTRLMSLGGLLAATLVPAITLGAVVLCWVFALGAPATISTLLFIAAGASLLSVLGMLLYVPFRLAVGVHSTRVVRAAAAA